MGHEIDPIYFYPRSPRGERLAMLVFGAVPLEISIHAPREGSDVRCISDYAVSVRISIHAPREGSDAAETEK